MQRISECDAIFFGSWAKTRQQYKSLCGRITEAYIMQDWLVW